ncbi:hypothetical protein, partial [Bowdeniella nasicola]|uniref:hypothetical protein n=1 Tax=Bowdeniella nasicola TaxID=208480 RepID=UPI001C9E35DD
DHDRYRHARTSKLKPQTRGKRRYTTTRDLTFWHERIPRVASIRGWFTRLYVTDAADQKPWSERAVSPVGVLPWGSDVLNARVSWEQKTVDLLRMGRQPDSWDDDDQTYALLKRHESSLSFAPRPPFGRDDHETYQFALDAYGSAKVVLAFSNAVHSVSYTHPEREYVTGRWTDAIAAGCMVAGVVPDTESAKIVVPECARICVPPDDPSAGLDQIIGALGEYTKERYLQIRRYAAEYVDWHHRLHAMCTDLSISRPESLQRKLTDLDQLARGESCA